MKQSQIIQFAVSQGWLGLGQSKDTRHSRFVMDGLAQTFS